MPTEKPRYTITVDEELLKKIDDFRFEKRYQSRTAATIDLIKLGVGEFENSKEKTWTYSRAGCKPIRYNQKCVLRI